MKPSAADQAAIQKLFQNYIQSWHQTDIPRWSQNFTEDSDFITWRGIWWKNRAESLAGHQEIPPAVAAQMPNYQIQIETTEQLAPTVILVHARWHWPQFQIQPDPPEDRQGLLTMVLTKQSDQWLIRATHNVLIDQNH